MLISRLLRTLLRFLAPGIVPEGGGAPAAEPAAAPAPAAEPAAAPPAAAPAEPVDPFAALQSAIDALPTDGDPPAEPTAAPAPGQQRDPQGKFASASQKAAGVATEPTPAPTPAPTAAPKPGEFDLTPPDGMSERAQQRWGQLTERAKMVPQLEQRATEAETQLQSVRQLVAQSGLAPNEFTEMLELGRAFKSDSPQDAQRALQMLDGLRGQLAQRFGLDVAGVDPLAEHADLKQKVDGMLMTREDALEIARLRNVDKQARAQAAAADQQTREAQAHRQSVQNASTAMETALNARAGTPGHEAKVGYIRQHFANPQNLQAFVRTYQPQQWAAVVMTMYDAYTPPAAPVPPQVPQPLRPQPVRAGAPQHSGPVTPQSAIESAFAAAGL